MKRILLVIAIAFMATYANAQNAVKQVPQMLSDAFTKLYPSVKDVKWENEDGYFEAHFKMNKLEMSATFDPVGTFLESEVEIKVSQLPQSAFDYMVKTYPGQKPLEASKITSAKGIITYEAAIKTAEVTFDDKGSFIKEEKIPISKQKK